MFPVLKTSFSRCWKLARMVIRYYLSSARCSLTQHYVLCLGRQLAAELHSWYSEENFYFLCATLHLPMSTEDFFNFKFLLAILKQIQSHSRIFLIRKHFWVDIFWNTSYSAVWYRQWTTWGSLLGFYLSQDLLRE